MNANPSKRSTAHIADPRLNVIANGTRPTEEEELHLTICRRCSAFYAELVHARAMNVDTIPAAPDDILHAGHEFVRAHAANSGSRRSVLGLGSRGWTLALASAAALVLLLSPLRQERTPSFEVPGLIRAELVEESAHGLVHPLVTDSESFARPARRGGNQPVASDVLDQIQARYDDDPESVERAAELVGAFQALGQIRNARSYLTAALERHPFDSTLQALAIEQAYREGNSAAAEGLLRERLGDRPDDTVAQLNLAILLAQRSDPASRQESLRLASEVAEREPSPALVERARQILP